MRLTGGEGKGRRLADPPDGVRPTSGRVKDSLFNRIASRLPGARVLDLYAGSGALGIEAVARGADSVVFIENDRRSQQVIRENLKRCGFQNRGELIAGDVMKLLQHPDRLMGRFDLVFADPPYTDSDFSTVMGLLRQGNCLSPNGLVVFEGSSRSALPAPEGWILQQRHEIGDTALYFLEPEDSPTT
ncbi:MAG: 16S rRNA (guanine(966)-N(2))-methyltransferase RsmD [bacterium]